MMGEFLYKVLVGIFAVGLPFAFAIFLCWIHPLVLVGWISLFIFYGIGDRVIG